MSDLQLSLLGLGAVLVAGVWGYNKLQERKYRQAAEKVFRNEQPDVLVPAEEASPAGAPAAYDADEYAERREPGFADAADAVEDDGEFVAAAETGAAHEAVAVSADMQAGYGAAPAYTETSYLDAPDVSDAPAAVAGLRNAPSADWCDDSIDLIARLHFPAGVPAEDLRQAQTAMQAHQRVHLRAFVDLGVGRWAPLAEAGAGAYNQVWFALQLVDRRGAVSTNDFEALRHSLQALVSLRNGELVFPDVAAMGEQARALDDFCAQLDLQLALNVLDAGNGAFAGTKVRGLAEAAGMRLSSGGDFQAHDENGNFLFALANMGEPFEAATLKNLHTHGLTFLLDVPHVRDGGYAFERMLASARQFANALDAALVNAQRAPVSEAMVDSIRKKIFEIHEQMNLAGISAGGVRALRLFS